MASEIRVASAALANKKEELQSMNQKFKEITESLEATARTLEGGWEGESHDAFYAAFQNDRLQMNNFAEAVQSYIQALDMIIAGYEAAEAQNTGIASARSY